ncbi:LysR family transcriptional regulator [Acetobacter estunensis NRIC 0472]|uniref:LysR family transcriptional regulator n=1 Tax=Acetobacter estunensis TaxID=104097 RepID=A0A967EHE3_9PROT|nr:LysR family transcriptional regulator [Acetobacter estunensis]NHO53467.1 LysR family transcriptional regulator [Acetobacter estunensis]GBQ28983.1 LysR family transcriptional regulator [Acetobacter estunensis NRIC 0472]
MDRIDLFRVFLRVAETSSFSQAAISLNLPRSSVSTAIQELEARVGARLFARTTRKVALTTDGRLFHGHALRVVSDMEEAEGLFRHTPEDARGLIRVDMPGRIGRLIVAPALPGFLDRHPGIDVMLGVTDRAMDLVEKGVDCALRVGALADSRLIGRLIGRLEIINVASPSYLARHGTPMSPQDLSEHFAVPYASPTTGRIEDWEWEEDGAVRTQTLRSRVRVNSAEAQIACCVAGLGLIQIPAYDVRPQLERGELVEILPDWRAESLPLTLLYPERRHASVRLRVFTDWLVPLIAHHIRHPPPFV